MSIICLQFGQCGNQVGESLYNNIYEDVFSSLYSCNKDDQYCTRSINRWFDITECGKWEPRSIQIDTEQKVLDCKSDKPYIFKNNIAKSYGGSANNWALGYTIKGGCLVDEVLDCIRRETEKCDFLTSFLNIFASSGGTGSGVGCRVIEAIRHQYPNKVILNSIILPYNNGEVVTQSYNSLLTLAKLYSIADANILFENERLHYVCQNVLNIRNINFNCLNTLIAEQLSSVLQPLNNDVSNIGLLTDLTTQPLYKYLSIKSAPYILQENIKYETACHWKSLSDSLFKQSRYDYQQQIKLGSRLKVKFVNNLLISRGLDKPKESEIRPIVDSTNYVKWLPVQEAWKNIHHQRSFNELQRYLALISNSNAVFVPLNSLVADAWNLFTHEAYLHHYKKFDVDIEYFLGAFQIMENILHDYKSL